MKIFSLVWFIFFFIISSIIDTTFIQPNTSGPIKAYSINQNYTTEYSINIYIPTLILLNGYIEVEFPLLFQIPPVCNVKIKTPKNFLTKSSCEKLSELKYIIQVGKIIPGEYQILFENIRNPTLERTSSFKIKTYSNRYTLIDSNEDFGTMQLLPSPCKKAL